MRPGVNQRVGVAIAAGFFALTWARVLIGAGIRFTNDDQTIFWYVAQEYLHGHFREPLFYGSPYASHVEAALAAPLLAAGLGPDIAIPLATGALTAAPWILYARAAWRRHHPIVAMVLLCTPLVLPVDYIAINTQAAHGTGVAVAAIASALVLGPTISAAAYAAFALLSSLAVLLYPNAIFVAAPAALVVLLTHFREARLWCAGGAGAAVGAVLYVSARNFYLDHQSFLLHPQWPLQFQWIRLRAGVMDINRHIGAVTPVGLPAAWSLLIVVAVAGWLTWKTRNWSLAAATMMVVVGVVASLGIPKVHDGSAAIPYSYGRFFLALPSAGALMAILWADAAVPTGSPPRRASAALAAVLFAFVVWHQVTLGDDISRVMSVTSPVQTIIPRKDVLETCEALRDLAEKSDSRLVVHAHLGVYAYGCGALWYGSLETLFPSYDRRTVRLFDERRQRRRAILVAEADDTLCGQARASGLECVEIDDRRRVVVIRSNGLSAIDQARALGMAVRRF